MRILIGALAVALLAGCVSPTISQMRDKGPAGTYTSAKSEGDLSKCVLFAWQDTSLAGSAPTVSIQPGRDGGTTVTTGGNEYFVDLKSAGSKTSARYYEVGDTWISRKLQPKLKSCL